MATATKKCCGCKKRFKSEGMIVTPIGLFHSKQCRFDYATKDPKGLKFKADKFLDDKCKAKKKVYNDNKLSTRERAAKEACHLYIRTRDKDKLCPCCGEPLGDDFHAGHFWESGNYSFIRYHEDNIHGQRLHCNLFKGGDSGFYRPNLIERIGAERVKYLDDNRSNKVKPTADYYREIELKYKLKLKDLIQ